MKRMRWAIGLICVVVLGACASIPKDTLTQVSTIDALLVGAYDGQMSCRDLLKYGDFGLGTFDHLDGEMIVLDGTVYQAKSNGTIARPRGTMTTPFAAVVRFDSDLPRSESVAGLNFNQLESRIDDLAPNQNSFCAVRVDGHFAHVKVRIISAQKKPYPALAEAAKVQPVYEYENVSGTIVGFRCPAYVKGINVPGYHLHFISDDRMKGGHLLGLECQTGELQLDRCHRFSMILPEGDDAFGALDLTKDRSRELHQVERTH